MTEGQWEASRQPEEILYHLGERASQRRLRLFACAVCRLAWRLLTDERSRRAVEAAERFANGEARGALGLTWAEASRVSPLGEGAYLAALVAIMRAEDGAPFKTASSMTENSGVVPRSVQADLMRCLFGNPFRPVTFAPALRLWNGGAAVALARSMYVAGDFTKAALLADLVEEGGAADPRLLRHLRGPGPHARGCFAVDLVLGLG